MATLMDPFDALSSFQQALDTYRTSSWLEASVSGGGGYPPVNVFRKGDDFIIIVAELPGVKKSDLEVQVKGRTIRLAGTKTVGYPVWVEFDVQDEPKQRSPGRKQRLDCQRKLTVQSAIVSSVPPKVLAIARRLR